MRKATGLAVELRPRQFTDGDLPNEPAELAAAQQAAREKLHLLDNLRPDRALGERAERSDMLQRHDKYDGQYALRLLGESQIEWPRGQNVP